jgi:hypothetical protein
MYQYLSVTNAPSLRFFSGKILLGENDIFTFSLMSPRPSKSTLKIMFGVRNEQKLKNISLWCFLPDMAEIVPTSSLNSCSLSPLLRSYNCIIF